MRIALAALALVVTLVPAAAAEPYLSEVFAKHPQARQAYRKMLTEVRRLPEWLGKGRLVSEVIQTQGKATKVDGATYTVVNECWKQVCEENELLIAFSPDWLTAYGRLTAGDRVQWLGDPSGLLRSAINATAE